MPARCSWTLAFGSCNHQEMDAPALLSAAASKPDVFAWLGDNVYNDLDDSGMPCEPIDCRNTQGLLPKMKTKFISIAFNYLSKAFPAWAERIAFSVMYEHNRRSHPQDMEALSSAYETLGKKPEFLALRAAVPEVLATWDDHDFCRNDAGGGADTDVIGHGCPWANESQALFLKFWRGEGALAARQGRKGVYEAYTFTAKGGHVARVIMLDTRSWRTAHRTPNATDSSDEVASEDGEGGACLAAAGPSGYCQQTGPGATLLGAEQWAWLEQELAVAADVRVIGSSISFGAQWAQNGDETWSVFPAERQRMFDLIKSTRSTGVVFISGDLQCVCMHTAHQRLACECASSSHGSPTRHATARLW